MKNGGHVNGHISKVPSGARPMTYRRHEDRMDERTAYVARMLGMALSGEKTNDKGADLSALDVNGRVNFIALAEEIRRTLGKMGR